MYSSGIDKAFAFGLDNRMLHGASATRVSVIYFFHFVHSALIPHAAVVCMGIFNALLLNCTLYNVQ